jgi:hypothetical protein
VNAITAKGSISILKLDLITRMVQSVPWIVIKNEDRLKNFILLSQLLIESNSTPLKLTGVKLISAFVEA